MTCLEFEEHLDSALHDHSRSMGAEAREHLQACARCKELMRDWVWLDRQMKALPAPAPGLGFTTKVVRQVTSDSVGARNWSSVPASRWWAIAAAVCVALVAALLYYPKDQDPVQNRLASEPPKRKVESIKPDETREATAEENIQQPVAISSMVASFMESVRTDQVDPDSSTVPQEPVGEKLLASLDIGEAVRRPKEDLVNTGSKIGESLQPATRSAVGAFRFLWNVDVEKPEI